MIEQDYIMRLIREMIRALLKIFFHIDTDNPTAELIEDEEKRGELVSLLDMVDAGHIDEAENSLHAMFNDNDLTYLEMALVFYDYLNEKSDDFLETHRYERQEIKFGVRDFARRFGISGIEDLFV